MFSGRQVGSTSMTRSESFRLVPPNFVFLTFCYSISLSHRFQMISTSQIDVLTLLSHLFTDFYFKLYFKVYYQVYFSSFTSSHSCFSVLVVVILSQCQYSHHNVSQKKYELENEMHIFQKFTRNFFQIHCGRGSCYISTYRLTILVLLHKLVYEQQS